MFLLIQYCSVYVVQLKTSINYVTVDQRIINCFLNFFGEVNFKRALYNYSTNQQGWEFDHRFFYRIDRFLWSKNLKIDSIMKRSNRSRRSFVKLDGIESLTVNLVKRSTRLIRSKISKDRRSKGRKIELSTLHMNREQNIHS